MPKNGEIKRLTKDQALCDLEIRQPQPQLAPEHLQLRQGILENALQRFKKLYQNSPVGFITFDHVSRIIDINEAALRLLQTRAPSVLGLAMTALISPSSCEAFTEHLRKSRRASGLPVSTEVEMITASGPVLVQMSTSAILLDSGRIFETALIDLTAQRAAADAEAKARKYAEGIVSSIPYPILVLDHRGRVLSGNSAFYYLFQTSESQVVNWPITQLPDVNWLTPQLDEILAIALAEECGVEGVVIRAERSGSLLTLSLNVRRLISEVDLERGQCLLAGFEDITKRKRAEEEREGLLAELQKSQLRLERRVSERTRELADSYLRLQAVGEQIVLAHETEQRRIAREMHDQVGQDLTALKLILNRGKNAGADEARKALAEAAVLTEELLQTVRNICSTLRPQVLDDLGLVQGLQWHIRTFGSRTGLDITFDLGAVDETLLSPIIQSTIFRVMQEALTNVSRHAQTKTASVVLAMRKGSVEFSVRDGGKGFDVPKALETPSTGLSGMRERVSLVGGKFEIASSPGQGTIITARIPATPRPTPVSPAEPKVQEESPGPKRSRKKLKTNFKAA